VFRQTLHDLGWVEGRNIIIEMRAPAREGDPHDDLVADLIRLKVDVIVASGPRALRAAKKASSTIPIVMSPSAADPVREGFIASLARPGGNMTGLTLMSPDLAGKHLELLREIVSQASRIAVLWNPGSEPTLAATRVAAKALGIALTETQVTQSGELEKAIEAASRDRAHGLIPILGPLNFGMRARISELALQFRLPTVFALPSFVRDGGLLSYGPNDTEYYRRAAVYVDKILKGAKPGDLPVEQPTRIELHINMKTAKALGLSIPQSLLFRADKIIE
jgi:putative ABC transport system substrate-binding protein